MARPQPGETSKPLVIALAFFVLTTLVLGVMVFMDQSHIAAAQEEAKKAKSDETAAKKVATSEEEKKLLYKGAMGLLSADEQSKLQSLREKEAVREEYTQMMAAIERRVQAVVRTKADELRTKDPRAAGAFNVQAKEVLDWEWPQDGGLPVQPRSPLVAGIVDQYAAQRLSNIEVQQKTAQMDAAMKKADERAKAASDREVALKAEQDEYPKKVAAEAARYDKELAAIRAEYAKLTGEYNDKARQHAALQEELNLKARQAAEDLGKQRTKADKLEAERDAVADQFAYDQPHGKIQRRNGNLVEINLGSADNVKAGLKFAVMPSDTPRKGLESRKYRGVVVPKAKIEVVSILGEHQAQARILAGSEVNPIQDSVIVGDLLYNAVWRKGEPDHVALFGIFDLNGDGTDDIARLASDLTKMGIVVDAWYDLGQKKWQGKLTEKTIYAVQGNVPFKNMNAGEPEGVLRAKGDIQAALTAAEKEARERGTKVVKMRDAFPRIGYPVNLDVDERRIDQAASKYLRAAPAGDAATPPGM